MSQYMVVYPIVVFVFYEFLYIAVFFDSTSLYGTHLGLSRHISSALLFWRERPDYKFQNSVSNIIHPPPRATSFHCQMLSTLSISQLILTFCQVYLQIYINNMYYYVFILKIDDTCMGFYSRWIRKYNRKRGASNKSRYYQVSPNFSHALLPFVIFT